MIRFSNGMTLARWAIVLSLTVVFSGRLGAQDSDRVKDRFLTATIESPGGPLEFDLQIRRDGDQFRSWLINGHERIPVPRTTMDHQQLFLDIDHYDSTVKLEPRDNSDRLTGTWKKRRGSDAWTRMNITAAPRTERSWEDPARFLGRWRVKFSGSDDPAVAVFKGGEGNQVDGTFLTSLGDYRYLSGGVANGQLRLSCFDGAHAFLFHATITESADDSATESNPAARLSGDFWSRESWHETWTAVLDPEAKLADPLGLSQWNQDVDLSKFVFPDLDGQKTSLADPDFDGEARILYLFGSWCPNCHDAGALLSEYHRKYSPRGLRILGLAFELTGQFDRDAAQVRKYLARHQTDFPVLVAGLADKETATKTLPIIDRIRAYPTMIFLDRTGRARAVYTGFSGPATGPAHERLREQFENLIEQLLDPDQKKSN